MDIEIVNTDQAAAWDGHEGDIWTEHADRYEHGSRRYLDRLIAANLIGREDRVVDIGCGTGKATREVAKCASGGSAVGIDLSTRMLDLARRRASDEGIQNVTFLRGDAQVHPFERGAFDVAMSTFGTMFFNDPVAAFTNIGAGVRVGGRLAMLVWRSLPENAWLVSLRAALALGRDLPVPPPDAPTPFSLADPDRARSVLGEAGFHEIELAAWDEPMELGRDAADAMDFAGTMGIVEGLSEGLSSEERATAMLNLRELFEECASADGVLLDSAAWLITATRA